MTLPLPDLTQVIDEILQVSFVCYEGILLWMCFFCWRKYISLSHTLTYIHMLTRYTLERIDISQLYQDESEFFFFFFLVFIYINDEFRLRCGLKRGV